MTYDSIISHIKYLPYTSTKLILSPWREQGFKVKHIPDNLTTSIFAYILPEYLKIESEDIEKLKSQDYQMDEWLRNKRLVFNDKYPSIGLLKEHTKDPTMKGFLDVVDDF